MDPIRPKFTQNVPNSSPIYYMIFIYYIIALKAHKKAVTGAQFA